MSGPYWYDGGYHTEHRDHTRLCDERDKKRIAELEAENQRLREERDEARAQYAHLVDSIENGRPA